MFSIWSNVVAIINIFCVWRLPRIGRSCKTHVYLISRNHFPLHLFAPWVWFIQFSHNFMSEFLNQWLICTSSELIWKSSISYFSLTIFSRFQGGNLILIYLFELSSSLHVVHTLHVGNSSWRDTAEEDHWLCNSECPRAAGQKMCVY